MKSKKTTKPKSKNRLLLIILVAGAAAFLSGIVVNTISLLRAYSAVGMCSDADQCPLISQAERGAHIGTTLIYLGLAAVLIGATLVVMSNSRQAKSSRHSASKH